MDKQKLEAAVRLLYRKLTDSIEFQAFYAHINIDAFVNQPYVDEFSSLLKNVIKSSSFSNLSPDEVLHIDSYCRAAIILKKHNERAFPFAMPNIADYYQDANIVTERILKMPNLDLTLQIPNSYGSILEVLVGLHIHGKHKFQSSFIERVKQNPHILSAFFTELFRCKVDIIPLLPDLRNAQAITQLRFKHGISILQLALINICTYNDGEKIRHVYLDFVRYLVQTFPELVHVRNQAGENSFFYLPQVDVDKEVTRELVEMLQANNLDINELGATGNSALYCTIHTKENRKENGTPNPIIYELFKHGARYIRNGKQEKFPIHVAVALNCIQSKEDVKQFAKTGLDITDDEKKTALHYAAILGKTQSALLLLDADAKFDILDKYGRTALDYAILAGDVITVQCMLKSRNGHHKQRYVQQDKYFSKFVLACLSGNVKMYELIEHKCAQDDSSIDQIIKRILAEDAIKPELLDKLPCTFALKLLILSAVVRINPKLTENASAYVKALKNGISKPGKQISNDESLAYGIELEIVNVSPALPLNLPWFNVSSVQDPTVAIPVLVKPLTTKTKYEKTEYEEVQNEVVSNIITRKDELRCFLTMTKLMRMLGGIANDSTGCHIHINLRGGNDGEKTVPSIATVFPKTDKCTDKQVEFLLAKQILLNFAMLEPLLQGVLRNGFLFDNTNPRESYVAIIQPLVPVIMQCKDFEELFTCIDDRFTSFNLLSLKSPEQSGHGHGTIEIRMHEGTVDEIRLRAWLNLVHRLVLMSKEQVAARLRGDNPLHAPFTAYPDIERLIYIFMAEREYKITWDNERGAPRSTEVSAAPNVMWSDAAKALKRPMPIQVDIQNSLLYNLYLKAKANAEFCSLFLSKLPNADIHVVNDLEQMIHLVSKFPGPLDKPIDMAKFQAQIKDMRLAIEHKPYIIRARL